MKQNVILIILIILAIFSSSGRAEAAAQVQGNEDRFEVGFITGAGGGPIDDESYRVILLAAHIGYNVKIAPHRQDRSGILSIFMEPQVNPVFSPRNDYEAGIGFGIQYLYPLTKILYPYMLASAGPHYISYNSNDQAPGFNFLLTAGAGFYYYLNSKMAVNLGWRFRHISNAGLRRPNQGINLHGGVIGLSFFF